jgi:hypothetical protein
VDNTNLMESKSVIHILKSSTNISTLASGRGEQYSPPKSHINLGCGPQLTQTLKAPMGEMTNRDSANSGNKNKKKRKKSQVTLNS